MAEEKKEQGKKCFIITPIGNDGSDIFRKAKGVIDSVIKPVLQRNGFDDIKCYVRIGSQTCLCKIDYSSEYMDNPIYSGIRVGTIFKKMDADGRQNEAEVLQKILDKISDLSGANNTMISEDVFREKIERPSYGILLDIERCDENTLTEFINNIATGVNGVFSVRKRENSTGNGVIQYIEIIFHSQEDLNESINKIRKIAEKNAVKIKSIY